MTANFNNDKEKKLFNESTNNKKVKIYIFCSQFKSKYRQYFIFQMGTKIKLIEYNKLQ